MHSVFLDLESALYSQNRNTLVYWVKDLLLGEGLLAQKEHLEMDSDGIENTTSGTYLSHAAAMHYLSLTEECIAHILKEGKFCVLFRFL